MDRDTHNLRKASKENDFFFCLLPSTERATPDDVLRDADGLRGDVVVQLPQVRDLHELRPELVVHERPHERCVAREHIGERRTEQNII